jgi:hypothetical protein
MSNASEEVVYRNRGRFEQTAVWVTTTVKSAMNPTRIRSWAGSPKAAQVRAITKKI